MVVKKKLVSLHRFIMVAVAQLVRASDCGPEGRRFDPGQPPTKTHIPFGMCVFLLIYIFLLSYNIIKCDEMQYIKNKKSKTYKNLGFFLWVLRDSNP